MPFSLFGILYTFANIPFIKDIVVAEVVIGVFILIFILIIIYYKATGTLI